MGKPASENFLGFLGLASLKVSEGAIEIFVVVSAVIYHTCWWPYVVLNCPLLGCLWGTPPR